MKNNVALTSLKLSLLTLTIGGVAVGMTEFMIGRAAGDGGVHFSDGHSSNVKRERMMDETIRKGITSAQ